MQVYKFGGASVKGAEEVRQVAKIIQLNLHDRLIVVVSAMGKTTNRLEEVVNAFWNGDKKQAEKLIDLLKADHFEVINDLDLKPDAVKKVEELFHELNAKIDTKPSDNYHFEYDAIVSFGELISTTIVGAFLNQESLNFDWQDAREIIKTNQQYQEGIVDLSETKQRLFLTVNRSIKNVITQGFIGGTSINTTTTLGREGSDYSAAILAWCAGADSLTIWKDVPGLLNADPKKKKETVLLPTLSYKEAVELSYFGASVIHPKTIQPLQNKNIPLYVKSFYHPNEKGSIICNNDQHDGETPSYIIKENQLLISIMPHDFSFVVEEHLSEIFAIFHTHQVKVNLMQNSALNFTVVTTDSRNARESINTLNNKYRVLYNENTTLITIRHYKNKNIDDVVNGREVLLEQRTRQTLRYVVK